MKFIVFILGILFLGVFSAQAQNSQENEGSNPPVIKEVKVQSGEEFDVNQKVRVDKPNEVVSDQNKKSIRVDRNNRIPMTKVEGTCVPVVERREE